MSVPPYLRIVMFKTICMILITLATNAMSQSLLESVPLSTLKSAGLKDIDPSDYGALGSKFAPPEDILRKTGFKYKVFHPYTRDGYMVELLHIINPLADKSKLKKVPIILSHGFTLGAYVFVCQSVNETRALPWPRNSSEKWHKSSDRNLAILLANNGYDVWLATSRGSLSSTKPELKLHNRYSNKDPRFWRFTLDEQAIYDIPCQVNLVRRETGANKVIFAGYSQSTFTMLGQLALNPEFARKIHTFLVIAPITSMRHDTGMLRPLGRMVALMVPESFRDFAFLPVPVGRALTKMLLSLYSMAPKQILAIYRIVFNLLFGNNGNKGYDAALLIGRLFRFPTSMRGFLQFMQLQKEDRMSFYDYGSRKNLLKYGLSNPPLYNISNIESNALAIYVGENDCLSVPADNKIWIDDLKFPPIEHRVIPNWNHLDYMIAEDNDVMLNRPILRLLDKRLGIVNNKLATATKLSEQKAPNSSNNKSLAKPFNKVISSKSGGNTNKSQIDHKKMSKTLSK